jgi:hypothetical protein
MLNSCLALEKKKAGILKLFNIAMNKLSLLHICRISLIQNAALSSIKSQRTIDRLFSDTVQWGGSILRRFILRHRVVGWMPISAAVADRFH